MSYEIDHLFVCTSVGAPEADQLIECGLTEGSPNVHPGQGTANRRFFFRNVMLELLWVDDRNEAESDVTGRTELWNRWVGRNHGTCPFGVCLRPSSSGVGKPPFEAWGYRPPFLPSDLVIHVGQGTPLTEPMLFFVAFGRRFDAVESERREPVEHSIGVRELTDIRIVAPCFAGLSSPARAVTEMGLASITPGHNHLMELTFDGNDGGKRRDFRPELPLVLRW